MQKLAFAILVAIFTFWVSGIAYDLLIQATRGTIHTLDKDTSNPTAHATMDNLNRALDTVEVAGTVEDGVELFKIGRMIAQLVLSIGAFVGIIRT